MFLGTWSSPRLGTVSVTSWALRSTDVAPRNQAPRMARRWRFSPTLPWSSLRNTESKAMRSSTSCSGVKPERLDRRHLAMARSSLEKSARRTWICRHARKSSAETSTGGGWVVCFLVLLKPATRKKASMSPQSSYCMNQSTWLSAIRHIERQKPSSDRGEFGIHEVPAAGRRELVPGCVVGIVQSGVGLVVDAEHCPAAELLLADVVAVDAKRVRKVALSTERSERHAVDGTEFGFGLVSLEQRAPSNTDRFAAGPRGQDVGNASGPDVRRGQVENPRVVLDGRHARRGRRALREVEAVANGTRVGRPVRSELVLEVRGEKAQKWSGDVDGVCRADGNWQGVLKRCLTADASKRCSKTPENTALARAWSAGSDSGDQTVVPRVMGVVCATDREWSRSVQRRGSGQLTAVGPWNAGGMTPIGTQWRGLAAPAAVYRRPGVGPFGGLYDFAE